MDVCFILVSFCCLLVKSDVHVIKMYEQTTKTLSCKDNYIKIHSIDIGPKTTCPYLLEQDDCKIDVSATTRIKTMCNGRKTCMLNDTEENFTSYCAKILKTVDGYEKMCKPWSKPPTDTCCNVDSNTCITCRNTSMQCSIYLTKCITINYTCEGTYMTTIPIHVCNIDDFKLETCGSYTKAVPVLTDMRLMPDIPTLTIFNNIRDCKQRVDEAKKKYIESCAYGVHGRNCQDLVKFMKDIMNTDECVWYSYLHFAECQENRYIYIHGATIDDCSKRMTTEVKYCKSSSLNCDGTNSCSICFKPYFELDFTCRIVPMTSTTSETTSTPAAISFEPGTSEMMIKTPTQSETSTDYASIPNKLTTRDQDLSTVNSQLKQNSSSGNTIIIGIAVGVGITVIMAMIVLVYLKRRSRILVKNSENLHGIDSGKGHQKDPTEYTELRKQSSGHNYDELKPDPKVITETSYDYIETKEYMLKANLTGKDNMSAIINHQCLASIGTGNGRSDIETSSNQPVNEYLDLDPKEQGFQKSEPVNTISEPYAILDPNVTGFNRVGNIDYKYPPESYAVLDPKVTGFNRVKCEKHSDQYELARPINDKAITLPTEVNDGIRADYGTGDYNRLNEDHKPNHIDNVYSHAADSVYNTAFRDQKSRVEDGTYDHFVTT